MGGHLRINVARRTMNEIVVAWVVADVRCVLCGDGTSFELRLIRLDCDVVYSEPVHDLLAAIRFRAPALRFLAEGSGVL